MFQEVPTDDARRALEAILRSKSFARSERSQRFLRYVCEQALAGKASRINEYLIGTEVFGRGPQYTPNEDSIVRRQAHALRYKLEEYYSNDGRGDPVRIELPLGHYVPVFRRQSDATRTLPNQVRPTSDTPVTGWRSITPAAFVLAGVLVGLVSGWMLSQPENANYSDRQALSAATLQIWGPWLKPDRRPLICLSNPLGTQVRVLENPIPPDSLRRHFQVVDRSIDQEIRKWLPMRPGGHVYMVPSVSQTKMGDAVAAVHIANLLGRAGIGVTVTQSRLFNWEDLRRESVILLGQTETNPWVARILHRMPLRLAAATGDRSTRILNANPSPGEPLEYHAEYPNRRGDPTREYALVSMMPSQDGRRRLLTISGINTQATLVASEFLTNPSSLQILLDRLAHMAPDHVGPWNFQAILRTNVQDKVPLDAGELVLVRIL